MVSLMFLLKKLNSFFDVTALISDNLSRDSYFFERASSLSLITSPVTVVSTSRLNILILWCCNTKLLLSMSLILSLPAIAEGRCAWGIPSITRHLAVPNSIVISIIIIQSDRNSCPVWSIYKPIRNNHCRILLKQGVGKQKNWVKSSKFRSQPRRLRPA